MATPNTSELLPPKSWDEFEELCADLFSREWNDAQTVRHGRQGQSQNGVDIYGKPTRRRHAGAQCKGRKNWPPKVLTKRDITTEVSAAKKFRPKLTEFLIVTTAPDDIHLQAHARAITERHLRQKQFSVHVLGWGEITRRLTKYPDLVQKYFGYMYLGAVHEDIRKVPSLTAELVAAYLRENGLLVGRSIAEALDRELSGRYETMLRSSLFPESNRAAFEVLAQEVLTSQYAEASKAMRRRILLRGSRSAALKGKTKEAELFLASAQQLEGDESDVPALARLAEAQGRTEEAIRLLRDRNDPDSRSTLLHVIERKDGAAAALNWMSVQGLSVPDLTESGVNTLLSVYLRENRFADARQVLLAVTDVQIRLAPNLLLSRSIVRLACLLPTMYQHIVLEGLPLAIPSVSTVGSESVVREELDECVRDLTQLLPIVSELRLFKAKQNAEGYLLWCELLHPFRTPSALSRLRMQNAEPKTSLAHLQFSFAFDSDFDPAPIRSYLDGRAQVGGLDDDELRASLILRLHGEDPKAVSEIIAKYRSRFEVWLTKVGITLIEVQALTLAGEAASAKLLLDQNRALLPEDLITKLEAEVAKAAGADPVLTDMRVYEQTKAPEALRSLVKTLIRKKDFRAIARYAEDLYAVSKDPVDILTAAQALANIGDGSEFIRVSESYPFLLERDVNLRRHYAWELFYEGRLKESGALVDGLRSTVARDLNLEIALAIESGEWETLSQPLSEVLRNSSQLSGRVLVQAAHLAQTAGLGLMVDLIRAAVAKAENDPHVWVGAYTLVLEEGLEAVFPDSSQWFSRGLDLSGDDGPIKRFALKDILSQQREWNEHTAKISDSITQGDIPLIVAAPGLRTTLVDVVVRNLIRNSALADGRRRIPVPLFAGSRVPTKVGDLRKVAVDISSVLVLGWLGLLPKVFQSFSQIVLSSSTLHELFEARNRVQRLQKSRIRHARAIQQAIARGRLKVAKAESSSRLALADEVGSDLAALIGLAKATSGIVLRPSPVYRPGFDFVPADLSAHAEYLTDMHTALKAMVDHGTVDRVAEEAARRYFVLEDKGWVKPADIDPQRRLFIDDLALSYLLHSNLFETLLDTFPDCWIHSGAQVEASTLLDYEGHIEAVLRVIDEIRSSIRAASKNGKLITTPQRAPSEARFSGPVPPTLQLLSNLCGANAVVIDDRALNKEPFAQDLTGTRVPCITSLDIVEELRSRGIVSAEERDASRHKLRVAGVTLMPVDPDELASAARRSRHKESREFRAIRDSVDLSRIARIPRFPKEIVWFGSISIGCKAALIDIWKNEADDARAAAISDLIFYFQPKPEDWVGQWDGSPPVGWEKAASRVLVSSIALPIDLKSTDVDRYNKWLERVVLQPLRFTRPRHYAAMVDQLRAFILRVAEGK